MMTARFVTTMTVRTEKEWEIETMMMYAAIHTVLTMIHRRRKMLAQTLSVLLVAAVRDKNK